MSDKVKVKKKDAASRQYEVEVTINQSLTPEQAEQLIASQAAILGVPADKIRIQDADGVFYPA